MAPPDFSDCPRTHPYPYPFPTSFLRHQHPPFPSEYQHHKVSSTIPGPPGSPSTNPEKLSEIHLYSNEPETCMQSPRPPTPSSPRAESPGTPPAPGPNSPFPPRSPSRNINPWNASPGLHIEHEDCGDYNGLRPRNPPPNPLPSWHGPVDPRQGPCLPPLISPPPKEMSGPKDVDSMPNMRSGEAGGDESAPPEPDPYSSPELPYGPPPYPPPDRPLPPIPNPPPPDPQPPENGEGASKVLSSGAGEDEVPETESEEDELSDLGSVLSNLQNLLNRYLIQRDRPGAATSIDIYEPFWDDVEDAIDNIDINDCVRDYRDGRTNRLPQAATLAKVANTTVEHWRRATMCREQYLDLLADEGSFRLKDRLMVRAAESMHAELLRAEVDLKATQVGRWSPELRGGGFDDAADDEKDERQSRIEIRGGSPDAKHMKDILARHTRDTKASKMYLINVLIKLRKSLASYEALRDRKDCERAYESYGHIIMEDAKNVKMTSTEVRCIRQATKPGPIPGPAELEIAADELVATWERTMGRSMEEVALSWNSMNRQLKALMAKSAEFSGFGMQHPRVSEMADDDIEEITVNKSGSFSDTPRPRGGGGDDESNLESSTLDTMQSPLD